MTAVLLIAGIVALVAGAELLVRGASRLAVSVGISPLVVGLTVVAFGTSAPEMAASLRAALTGNADLALGNVVGSNVFNVLGILGLSALVAPLAVAVRLVRVDVPIVLGVSLAVVVLAGNGGISRWEGLLLLAFIVGHTVWLVRAARREDREAVDVPMAVVTGAAAVTRATLAVLAGLAALVVGANWLVEGAVSVASALGVSERVIGLTLVAIGTSLPELATSVVAAVKGEAEISVGNVLGSNVFNLGLVVGTAFTIRTSPVPVFVIRQDIPILVLVTVVVAFVVLRQGRISRRSGIFFLALFAAYMAMLASRGAAP
jgi:cation:H+ antiporter